MREQKTVSLRFSNFFSQNLFNNQLAGVMIQAIGSFYPESSEKRLFVSAKTYENYLLSKEHCIAHHDDNMCFLINCRYHIILIEDIEELLQKLDALCFTHQHVGCFYTHFIYRSCGKIVANSEQLFDNVQRGVSFDQQNRGAERMPSISKKTLLRKKYKMHLFSSVQK